jgi:hypothetical protein
MQTAHIQHNGCSTPQHIHFKSPQIYRGPGEEHSNVAVPNTAVADYQYCFTQLCITPDSTFAITHPVYHYNFKNICFISTFLTVEEETVNFGFAICFESLNTGSQRYSLYATDARLRYEDHFQSTGYSFNAKGASFHRKPAMNSEGFSTSHLPPYRSVLIAAMIILVTADLMPSLLDALTFTQRHTYFNTELQWSATPLIKCPC